MSSINSLYFPTSLETIETISPSELKDANNINSIIVVVNISDDLTIEYIAYCCI